MQKGRIKFRLIVDDILKPDGEILVEEDAPWVIEAYKADQKVNETTEPLFDEYGICTLLAGPFKIPSIEKAKDYYLEDHEDHEAFKEETITQQVNIAYEYIWSSFHQELTVNPPMSAKEKDYALSELQLFQIFSSSKWIKKYQQISDSFSGQIRKIYQSLDYPLSGPTAINRFNQGFERIDRLQALVSHLNWICKISQEGRMLVKQWARQQVTISQTFSQHVHTNQQEHVANFKTSNLARPVKQEKHCDALFEDYLSIKERDKKERLVQFLTTTYEGKKPIEFCYLLYALVRLEFLFESQITKSQTKLSCALKNTLGYSGSRQILNYNITNWNSYGDYKKFPEEIKMEIESRISAISTFLER